MHKLVAEGEFFSATFQERARVLGGKAPIEALPRSENGGLEKMLRSAPSPSSGCPAHALLRRDGVQVDRSAYASWAHAFADGVSVIVNRADYLDASVRRACREMVDGTGLPHCYANVYCTPAGCRAVGAHADDRDVFVVQLEGRKRWRVWTAPPVPYPYPDEQVGKQLEVPSDLGESLEIVLAAGDVLYIPRGFVHEAESLEVSSAHGTFAVATHDWTWASVAASAVRSALDAETAWRRAMPFEPGAAPGFDPAGHHLPTKVAVLGNVPTVDRLRAAASAAINPETLSLELGSRVARQRKRDEAIVAEMAKTMVQDSGLSLSTRVKSTGRRPPARLGVARVVEATALVARALDFVVRQAGDAGSRIGDLRLPPSEDPNDHLRKISLADLGITLDLLERSCSS